MARGEEVVGLDSFTDQYDPQLKRRRLTALEGRRGFRFAEVDIAKPERFAAAMAAMPAIDRVLHMAGQSGVRHSVTEPWACLRDNVDTHLTLLEWARGLGSSLHHFVYASTSSVYGDDPLPSRLDDRAATPYSLYGAAKRADELMTEAYIRLYGLRATGLRFFTVYGPWGRPDMALYGFIDAICKGRPIRLYNEGKQTRDFLYIEDAVAGLLAALDRAPAPAAEARHPIYNLGTAAPTDLRQLIALLERVCGRKATLDLAPMHAGDVYDTCADISLARAALGFQPKTGIEAGARATYEWYRRHLAEGARP